MHRAPVCITFQTHFWIKDHDIDAFGHSWSFLRLQKARGHPWQHLQLFGVSSIPYKVRSGELDLYLSKPVNPLFRLTFENISPGSVPLILMSVCIIVYGTISLHMTLTPVNCRESHCMASTRSYFIWFCPMASWQRCQCSAWLVNGIGVVALFTAFTCIIWKNGLKHYNSASSWKKGFKNRKET